MVESIESLDVSEEEKGGMLGGNAKKLLNIGI